MADSTFPLPIPTPPPAKSAASTPGRGPWHGAIPVISEANDLAPPIIPAHPDPDVGKVWGKASDFEFDQNMNGEEASNQPTQSSGGTPEIRHDTEYRSEVRIESVPTGTPVWDIPNPFRFEFNYDDTHDKLNPICLWEYVEGIGAEFDPQSNGLAMISLRNPDRSTPPGIISGAYHACNQHTGGPGKFVSRTYRRTMVKDIALGDETISEVIGAHPDGSPITQQVIYERVMDLVFPQP